MNFNKLEKFYQSFFHCRWLRQNLKVVLESIVNFVALLEGFNFPKNYIRQQKIVMLFNLYEKETATIFKKIVKSGMTVVDAGAHIGYYTRLFSKLVGPTGKVYAFEADPENYQLSIINY